jgi:hypothetical protein
MQDYHVQYRDSGGWRTCITMSSSNGPERILIEMENAQAMYPGYDIRVVDGDGRLIDFLRG